CACACASWNEAGGAAISDPAVAAIWARRGETETSRAVTSGRARANTERGIWASLKVRTRQVSILSGVRFVGAGAPPSAPLDAAGWPIHVVTRWFYDDPCAETQGYYSLAPPTPSPRYVRGLQHPQSRNSSISF